MVCGPAAEFYVRPYWGNTMTLSDPEKLARYVQSLSGFEFYKTIDGNYDHIGATIADAVLQANNKYSTHVKPRVNRILAQYPETRTTSSVLRLLESIAATEFLDWRGIDRAVRFRPGWPPKIPHLWPLENPPPAHR